MNFSHKRWGDGTKVSCVGEECPHFGCEKRGSRRRKAFYGAEQVKRLLSEKSSLDLCPGRDFWGA